jgi:hypothetical protein
MVSKGDLFSHLQEWRFASEKNLVPDSDMSPYYSKLLGGELARFK